MLCSGPFSITILMNEQIPWWMSRTIWTGLASSIMAVVAASGALPIWISGTLVDEIITGLLGVLTVYFRAKAVKAIKPVTTITVE